MMKKGLAVAGILIVGAFVLVGLAPSASAFHGAWWRGFGTATVGNIVLGIDMTWGGRDASVQCEGGGCIGPGDGWFHFTALRTGVDLAPVAFQGIEDVRNIFFFGPFTNHHGQTCSLVEVTPAYLLTSPEIGLVLTGRQEGCMDAFPTRENHNHFSGVLGPFSVTIHADGFLVGGAPPVGAPDAWCCHG